MKWMKSTLILIVLSARASHQQDPTFNIKDVRIGGSGCPNDSTDIDLLGTGGLVFHGWNLTIGMGEDDMPSASCHIEIDIDEIEEGLNLAVGQAQISGAAGMDPGVQTTFLTTTSWSGAGSIEKPDESMIIGSAAGVRFLNTFLLNPVFENQVSECGASSVTLNIDLEVTMSRNGEGGATGQGVCNVEFAGVVAGLQPCEVVEAPPDKC